MEWKRWQSLPFKERHKLPSNSGIYVVVDCSDNVVYVGQAINLNARWVGKSHHRYTQLSRSNSKRHYQIHWENCPANELNQMEQYYIALFIPSMNGTRVKQYSLGKPQLKIQIGRGSTQYAYFRGNSEFYKDIAEHVGIFPCTADDEKYIAITKEQVVKRGYAVVIAIRYQINGSEKTTKILCSIRRLDNAFRTLRGTSYRGGRIIAVRFPLRRVRY